MTDKLCSPKGDYRSDDEPCSTGSNLLWNCMNKFSPKLPKSDQKCPILQLSSENPSKGDYRTDDEPWNTGTNFF